MSQPSRLLILPVAAVIIIAACGWRITNPRQNQSEMVMPLNTRPAPAFQLYDQNSTLVNLEAFLHRHTIVLVFFDGQLGPDANSTLQELRRFCPALKSEGVVIFGVSTALPQENRNNSSQPFPFPLLTDAVSTDKNSVHRVWGRLIPPPTLDKPGGTKPGVFLIDRKGLIGWENGMPMPDPNPETIVSRLLG